MASFVLLLFFICLPACLEHSQYFCSWSQKAESLMRRGQCVVQLVRWTFCADSWSSGLLTLFLYLSSNLCLPYDFEFWNSRSLYFWKLTSTPPFSGVRASVLDLLVFALPGNPTHPKSFKSCVSCLQCGRCILMWQISQSSVHFCVKPMLLRRASCRPVMCYWWSARTHIKDLAVGL